MNDALGNRIKSYEDCFRYILPPRQPIIVRLDGRAFHSLTRHMDKPFDLRFISYMDKISEELMRETQGCIFAYTQSDEISLLLQTDKTLESEAFFGGNIQKIVSILAATASVKFNQHYGFELWEEEQPVFDARCFILPWEDAPNYFLWRYKDCVRNSISSAAQAEFSHQELQNKNSLAKQEMLEKIGKSWHNLSKRERFGRFLFRKRPPDSPFDLDALNYKQLSIAIDVQRFA